MVVVTVIIPSMDYRITFFGQLKKPYDALRFLNFAFCVARSNKSPVMCHCVTMTIVSDIAIACTHNVT